LISIPTATHQARTKIFLPKTDIGQVARRHDLDENCKDFSFSHVLSTRKLVQIVETFTNHSNKHSAAASVGCGTEGEENGEAGEGEERGGGVDEDRDEGKKERG
jgi:hypothetical protein